MKNKIIALFLISALLLVSFGCTKKEEVKTDAIKFKENYESLNGKVNKSGKEHRTVSIDENNPFVYTTADELVKKIESNETFYVYFGDTLCPWCRSVIEKAIEVANNNKIDKIYYIPIWDEEGNEILRDKYIINSEGELERAEEGTIAYKKLLTYFDSVLKDYTLTNSKGKKVGTNEKRIFAPNYIYVKDGKVIKLVSGISDKQKDSRETLTEEMLNDEVNQFIDFFNN